MVLLEIFFNSLSFNFLNITISPILKVGYILLDKIAIGSYLNSPNIKNISKGNGKESYSYLKDNNSNLINFGKKSKNIAFEYNDDKLINSFSISGITTENTYDSNDNVTKIKTSNITKFNIENLKTSIFNIRCKSTNYIMKLAEIIKSGSLKRK